MLIGSRKGQEFPHDLNIEFDFKIEFDFINSVARD